MAPARVAVWQTGDWDGLDELRAALTGCATAAGPEEADAVLLATGPDGLARDAVAAVRERTQAPVLVLAARRSTFLLQEAADAEVADVLLLPQSADSVVFAVEKALSATHARAEDGARRARVATVFSPKGGAGKSTTAVNLAVSLAGAGRRTLLVDLDVHFGDAAIMLGLRPERTLSDVVAAPGALDAEKLSAYTTRHDSGLHVLAAPLRPEDAELVDDAAAEGILAAARSGYDAVVVDTPPFFHASLLGALDRTDELLLVLTPDVPTLKNARLALQTLALLGFPEERLLIVLNRASARVGFTAAEVATALERPVEVELPEDDNVAVGVNRGTPAVLLRPHAAYSRAVAALAHRLAQDGEPQTARRRRFLGLARSR